MPDVHGFDERSTRRIVEAVRKVERHLPSDRGGRRRGGDAPPGFWIELTGEGSGGRYSWKKVYRAPDGWEDAAPPVTGTNTAYEINEATGLSAGKRFFARFNGYDEADEPVYLFAASDSIGSGQYQFMLFQMVTQNQRGWDDGRCHPAR